ncbi:membrane-flanked domain-containing protein [Corynebacterium suranareeae]|uniref:Membrane-flanked domain-containing protein n=1 Tax=Corynebacterium suranareeae TaxID=2506452 RepID=A0A160PMP1_9CORY|nr:PH domain-containing protein [Corynebacterium suranareeae]BAU95039.1 membrane-flanked domain-containing protein [Corynebacterium suranareeae]
MKTSEEFRRVHRATPFLRIWTLLVAMIAAFAFNSGASVFTFIWGAATGEYGYALIPILLTLVGTVVVVALIWGITGIWWKAVGFRITDEEVQLKRGVISKDLRTARFDRIQAVDLVESFIARVFRLAEVRVETAGGSNSAINIGFLRKSEAEALKKELIDASHHSPRDASREAEEDAGVSDEVLGVSGEVLVPTIPIKRTLASTALTLTSIITIIGVILLFFIPFGVSVAVPFLAGMVPALWRLIDRSWQFNAHLRGDILDVSYGLANRRKQSIPLERIHAVHLEQPLLWRFVGWWTVTVTVVGYGATTGGGTSKILPVGSKELALKVLEAVGPLDSTDIAESADPAHISRPQYTPPASARMLTPIDLTRQGVTLIGEQPHAVIVHEGRFIPRMSVIETSHIQELTLSHGPLQRLMGLSTVVFNLVQGPVSMSASDLRAEDGKELLDILRRRQLPALESTPLGQISLD